MQALARDECLFFSFGWAWWGWRTGSTGGCVRGEWQEKRQKNKSTERKGVRQDDEHGRLTWLTMCILNCIFILQVLYVLLNQLMLNHSSKCFDCLAAFNLSLVIKMYEAHALVWDLVDKTRGRPHRLHALACINYSGKEGEDSRERCWCITSNIRQCVWCRWPKWWYNLLYAIFDPNELSFQLVSPSRDD